MILTLFFPMFPFDPPENIRKPKVFWCFQGDQKGTLGSKGLKKHFANFMAKELENTWDEECEIFRVFRGGSRTVATSKMERFVINWLRLNWFSVIRKLRKPRSTIWFIWSATKFFYICNWLITDISTSRHEIWPKCLGNVLKCLIHRNANAWPLHFYLCQFYFFTYDCGCNVAPPLPAP